MTSIAKRSSTNTSRRMAWLAAGAAVAMASAASAQDASTAVEEVIVTGSRIPRPIAETPSPVVVLNSAALQAQGLENLADVLTQRPQFGPAFGQSRTQSTFSRPAASGLNVVNLRNLGPNRSLVLINGRRIPSGTVGNNTIDLSTIPTANIRKVEVITGGASAIYGSDAIAGVVNIVTRRDFEGVEANISYGETFKNEDNQNPSASLVLGHGLGDRGHATLTLQYDYQGLVSCKDRYLCAEDFLWSGGTSAPVRGPAAYSTITPKGAFLVDSPFGQIPLTSRNGSFTGANGQAIIVDPLIDSYNRGPDRTLAIPTQRSLVAGEAHYDLTDRIEAYAELSYARVRTSGPFEAYPFQSPSLLDRLGLTEITIPVSNPFVPAAVRATALAFGDQQLSWGKRLTGLGDRGVVNRRKTSRGVIGLRGDLDNLAGFGREWQWDASLTYGRTSVRTYQTGLMDKTRLAAALQVEADPAAPGQFRCVSADARAQGCVPVNLFQESFTAAEAAWLRADTRAVGVANLQDAQASLSGVVADLPAGPLRAAAGVELRRTRAFADFDDRLNQGLLAENTIADLPARTFRTTEAYVEVRAPILADQPFAKSLNLEAAFRRSDPNFGEGYNTWKFGGDWSPIGGVTFRLMQARSVRAPNLVDISTNSTTIGAVVDPCSAPQRDANATRAANCAAAGIPANYNPPALLQQTVTGQIGGNPNLESERGDTLTFGVIFQAADFEGAPAWFRPFSLSVDRFQIEVDDAIQQLGRQNVANLCYDLAGSARDAYCSQVIRGTNPFVPGANFILNQVNDRTYNVGRYDVRGIDVEAAYRFALADVVGQDWGSLSITTSWTFYDKAKLTTPVATLDMLGFAGGSVGDQGWLKRQGRVDFGYTYGRLQAGWAARYIGKARQSPFEPANTPAISSRWYHDLQARFAVTPQVEIYGGINNVADKQPPFFFSGGSGTNTLDTVPAYYDVFGRQGYLGLKLRL